MQLSCKFGIIKKIKFTSNIFLSKCKNRNLKRIIIPKPVKHLEIRSIKDDWMATVTVWTWIWVSIQEWVTDREAESAAVHAVAKSWTWLSDWTELNWTELCYFSYKMWQTQYHKMSVHFKVICRSNSTPVKIVRLILR